MIYDYLKLAFRMGVNVNNNLADDRVLNVIIPAQFKAASIIGGDYERLWKDFFEAIAVEERKSRRRQMSHMPKKYWKHITEKKSSHYRKNELDH